MDENKPNDTDSNYYINHRNEYDINNNQQNDLYGLENTIPDLNAGNRNRVNKKILLTIFAAGALILALLFYLVSLWPSSSNKKDQQTPNDELVVIPAPPIRPIAIQQASTLDNTTNNKIPQPPEIIPIQLEPLNSKIELRTKEEVLVFSDDESQNEAKMTAALTPSRIDNPDNILLEGTYIRCVLSSRIVSDIPGNTTCIITENVYSSTGTKLLLPKGSKVIGNYGSGSYIGNRIIVRWHRILTPQHLDIRIDNYGTDSLGGNGLVGDYRSHWPSRLGATILISLMGDAFDYMGSKHMPQTSIETNVGIKTTATKTHTAKALENFAADQLSRMGMRPPTITINQGEIINIFVSQDVDFSNFL